MKSRQTNDEIKQFAYIVSHDLRAPLRILNRYAKFLEEDFAAQLDTTGKEYLSAITDSALKMDSLIQGLVTYVRLDTQNDQPTLINLDELLEIVIYSERLDQEATISIDNNLPELWGYPALCQTIFTHLLSNAAKFKQPAVPPSIKIGCLRDGDAWLFSVQDNGIGIEERHYQKIFDVFQRLHTEDEFPGIGIGLALTKKAVELQGGTIWVSSKPGEGTTFYFTIPIKMPNSAKET